MDTFSYNTYTMMSTPRLVQNPQFPSHALHLDITHRHCRTIITDLNPIEVAPPYVERLTNIIPPACLSNSIAAYSFVRDVFLTFRVEPNISDVHSLISCISRLDSGTRGVDFVCVEASMELVRNDVVIGDDVGRIVHNTIADDEESWILDAEDSLNLDAVVAFILDAEDWIGSNSDGLCKEVLKAVTIDKGTYGEGTACSICLEDFEEGCRAMRTLCAHLFHDECITKWIQKRNDTPNCPLCRSPLVG